ncbi:LADA_0C02674g1_1 [Lachancea dasiensis]|uniref:LADA_0C02674g1_1 n=1 Tax=Lachancea dasiensis TaxID=1072105 RepID=A0A1G4IYF9_9SACH|nr:LADA_0C02674g1_1 [Lachancea dasiensis]
MEYLQRLMRPGENQGFRPIPGTFSENERPASGETPENTDRTSWKKVARLCLGAPLLAIYYLMVVVISLMNILRPLNKLWSFYDRKNRAVNHEDAFSALMDNLACEHSSSVTKMAPEEANLDHSFSFASIYKSEDGTLLSSLRPGYAKLLQSAWDQGKFGIVYLHDPLLDNCGQFLGPLCSEKFVNLARQYQALIWMGDITNLEALQVANSLKVRKLPFLGLLAPKAGSKIQLIDSIEGEQLEFSLASLENSMAKYYPRLISLRQQQQNSELNRLMRQQQDARFHESLRQDQERDRIRAAELASEENQQREEALKQQWLLWRKSVLVDEPVRADNACRVAIRIIDQGRIVRHFDPNLPIEEIYAFVELTRMGLMNESRNDSPAFGRQPDYEYRYPFKLITPVPRCDLDPQVLIRDVDAIFPSGNIVMELIATD